VKAKSDKTMAGIELFDWGVSLTSQSEVIGVGLDGKILFQKQYEQPGESGRQALKLAGAVGSAYFGGKSNFQSGVANATVEMTYRDENGVIHNSRSFLVSDAGRAELNRRANNNAATAATINMLSQNVAKRFNALKQNSSYAYIFAKDKTADSKNKVLVKVSKKDGKEVDKIIVNNLKPLYEIDAATETLYYGNKNQLLIFE
jgi:hypothetical protein